jgi:S1-C subfamily serine protease
MSDAQWSFEPGRRDRPEMTPRPEPAATPPRGGLGRRLTVLALAGVLTVGAAGGGAAGAYVTHQLVAATATTAPATATPGAALPVAALAPSPVPSATAPPDPTAAPASRAVVVQAAATGNITEIYNRVGPSVVLISSRGGGRGGIGSGFIIDAQGHIITNNHVVQGASNLRVALSDGSDHAATVIGSAPGSDLALIKIEPPASGLTVARLGDSDAVVPGELTVAIGNPSGLEQTVTSGIVSSIGRTFGGGPNARPLRGLIQTDAAINPGNSGGPLLNAQGEVIGINTLKAPDTQGIGFAVPINTAKRLLPQLRAGGRISAPYLGISGRAITAQLAQTQGLPVIEGVLIVRTVDDGPAARAGIRGGTPGEGDADGAGGDIITAINDKLVRRVEDIGAILDGMRAGETVTVTVLRNGQRQNVTVTLGEWPNS